MLPEVTGLNTHERNVLYSGLISTAIDLAKAGAILSPDIQNDLIELEDRLRDEVAETQTHLIKHYPHPITLQNLGRIGALKSQGAIS